MRRVGEVSLRELVSAKLFARAGSSGRRTVGAGSNLAPFFPSGVTTAARFGRTGVSALHNFVPKPTPANLRRFAETPVARRAINVTKDRIAGMKWRIQARRGRSLDQIPEGALRAQILTENFEAPNPDDSFRSLLEQVLEDVIVGGFGAIELDRVDGWTGSVNGLGRRDSVPTAGGTPALPLLMWPVDGASIRIMTDWDGRPDSPRYVQATGFHGPEGQIVLNDDELSYIRLNPRTHTPFGLGRVEVAFETINSFLSAHRYASRLASNSVVQYALWLQDLSPAHHERLIRWWQDEIEGTGRVPILSVESKPEVLRFGAGTDADLRLAWQEFLLRVIADAFDLPAQFLGVERDVNRSTAAEMNELAFRSAVVPTARLVAEHLTRDAIGKKLGWTDLEFVFTDVDATDEMQQAQIDEILLRNGVVTVNEVRRARGLAEMV
ncbi:MAG: phage portal protein [Acidobacteriia bacterium]|nr:phage portal protein [Terriglobia bacterium]